jgi:hypothetical protein
MRLMISGGRTDQGGSLRTAYDRIEGGGIFDLMIERVARAAVSCSAGCYLRAIGAGEARG